MLSFSRILPGMVQPVLRSVSRRNYCKPNRKIVNEPIKTKRTSNELVQKTLPEQRKHEEEERKSQEEEENFKQEQYNLIVRGNFEQVIIKNRETFLQMVRLFKQRDVHRRNHCEFIFAAMKHMKEYDVHRDLSVYKELIDVMPKDKFVIRNMWQDMFMHYPKQQECIMHLLDEMAYHGSFGFTHQISSIGSN